MVDREIVDYEARRLAGLANLKIESHEDRCSERWEQARSTMAEIKVALNGLFKRWWWIVGLLIGGQAAVILVLLRIVLT